MAEYTTSVDIANRALVHVGASPNLVSFTGSKNAVLAGFLYDKVRVAEQREHIWKFTIVTASVTSVTTITYQDGSIRNLFPYPTLYLRFSSQDPRTQGTTHLQTTGGMQYSDFDLQQTGLLTSLPSPLTLRFASDTQNVLLFDPMFCEALAARLAVAMAPAITQNAQKIQQAQGIYNDLVSRARRLDAIEAGNQEPDEAEVHSERLGEMSPQAVAARAQGGRRG